MKCKYWCLISLNLQKTNCSKLEPRYFSLLILTKWLSKSLSQTRLYISFLSRKSHISSLMFFVVNYLPKMILFIVWNRQFPFISFGIILNWEVTAVALFWNSSDSLKNSEYSLVISSLKILLSKYFFNWEL